MSEMMLGSSTAITKGRDNLVGPVNLRPATTMIEEMIKMPNEIAESVMYCSIFGRTSKALAPASN